MPEAETKPVRAETRLELVERDSLSLLYEISQVMQGTIELDRVLHLILTCVTAGEALGFNRALLLLIDEKQNALVGGMGVGPSSQDEAHHIWSELARKKHSLEELLALYETSSGEKSRFCASCRQMCIPINESADTVVRITLSGNATIVKDALRNPQANPVFVQTLASDSFAAAPLVAGDTVIGAIIADNIFSQQPITDGHLRTLSLFGLQAGIAIERARLHEKLVESQKAAAIGKLAANIAHEIRNPLVAIGGFARRIEKDISTTEESRRKLRIIVGEVEHMERVIREVLDLARPVRRSEELADVNQIVESALAMTEENLQNTGIELVCRLSPDLPEIPADVHEFRNIFTNLISNAISSMPQGGRLAVRTGREHNHIKVTITDTGVGIAEELQKRIFEPFFSTKIGGTGLGLAMGKKIVEEYGGEIQVESNPGQGASFTVILPIPKEGK